MAITVTTKGTAAAISADPAISTLTKASVAIANGASIIVGVTAADEFGGITSVTWNGEALTCDKTVTNAGDVQAALYSKHNVTGATGSVVVTMASSQASAGICLSGYQVEGLKTSSVVDDDSSATDSGTSVDPGIVTASQANECIIACGGAQSEVEDTWQWLEIQNALEVADEQYIAADIGENPGDVNLSTITVTTSAADDYELLGTITSCPGWAAVVVGYKAAPADVTATPDSVAIAASIPAQKSEVTAVPASVGMILASSGGATNVLAKPASVAMTAAIPTQTADLVTDSFDPTAVVNVPAILSGPVGMVLRPTTPASLGDQSRNSSETSGDLIGSTSGDIYLYGTVIDNPVNVWGTISYIKLYALVSSGDTIPEPNVYTACTVPQFIVKVSGGARTTYGLVSGAVPTAAGQFKDVWVSDNLTARPAGGAWTWTDLTNLVELGITAHYVLGSGEYTNLQLDEVWLEVYSTLGSPLPPIEVSSSLGTPIRMTLELPSTL